MGIIYKIRFPRVLVLAGLLLAGPLAAESAALRLQAGQAPFAFGNPSPFSSINSYRNGFRASPRAAVVPLPVALARAGQTRPFAAPLVTALSEPTRAEYDQFLVELDSRLKSRINEARTVERRFVARERSFIARPEPPAKLRSTGPLDGSPAASMSAGDPAGLAVSFAADIQPRGRLRGGRFAWSSSKRISREAYLPAVQNYYSIRNGYIPDLVRTLGSSVFGVVRYTFAFFPPFFFQQIQFQTLESGRVLHAGGTVFAVTCEKIPGESHALLST